MRTLHAATANRLKSEGKKQSFMEKKPQENWSVLAFYNIPSGIT